MPAEPAIILRGHTASVTALHFLDGSDKRLLLSGDETGELQLWDLGLEEGDPVSSAQGSPVLNIAGRRGEFYVQYKDGALLRGPLDRISSDGFSFTGASLAVPFEPAVSFCRMRLLGEHCLLLPGPDSAAALLADARGALARCGTFARAGAGMLTAVCAAGRGAFLAAYEDGSLVRWEVRLSKEPVCVAHAATDALFALARAPRGRVAVAAGGVDAVVALADVDEGPMHTIRKERLRTLGVGDAEWRPDSRVVATAGWDGAVRVWSGKRAPQSLLRPLAALRWHSQAVQRVAFSRDSVWLASAGSDQTIALWDVFQPEKAGAGVDGGRI